MTAACSTRVRGVEAIALSVVTVRSRMTWDIARPVVIRVRVRDL